MPGIESSIPSLMKSLEIGDTDLLLNTAERFYRLPLEFEEELTSIGLALECGQFNPPRVLLLIEQTVQNLIFFFGVTFSALTNSAFRYNGFLYGESYRCDA